MKILSHNSHADMHICPEIPKAEPTVYVTAAPLGFSYYSLVKMYKKRE